MANRKLGRTTDIRTAMLKNLTTDLFMYGKITTTEARAKEVKSIADSLIALAVKEKDNFEMVDVKVVKAKVDSKGNKLTEMAKSKNVMLIYHQNYLMKSLQNIKIELEDILELLKLVNVKVMELKQQY